jgi:hypothetical protein
MYCTAGRFASRKVSAERLSATILPLKWTRTRLGLRSIEIGWALAA